MVDKTLLKTLLEEVENLKRRADEASQSGQQGEADDLSRQAVNVYLQAQELDPADPKITFELGDAYFNLGEYVKARECYEKALPGLMAEMRKDWVYLTHLQLAWCYYKDNNREKVLYHVNEVLQTNPNNSTALGMKRWCSE